MLGLPLQTELNEPMSKKRLLSKMLCTTKQRNTFNSDIQSIQVVNEISPHTVAISEGKTVKAIFIIEVILKNYEPSIHTIELLFDLISRNIVLVLHFDEYERLVVKNKKIFFNDWSKLGYSLSMEGLNLDDVWSGFVSKIGNVDIREGETLDAAVDRKIRNEEIVKQIEVLKKKMNSIKTQAMKYDIYNEILKLKEQQEG